MLDLEDVVAGTGAAKGNTTSVALIFATLHGYPCALRTIHLWCRALGDERCYYYWMTGIDSVLQIGRLELKYGEQESEGQQIQSTPNFTRGFEPRSFHSTLGWPVVEKNKARSELKNGNRTWCAPRGAYSMTTTDSSSISESFVDNVPLF